MTTHYIDLWYLLTVQFNKTRRRGEISQIKMLTQTYKKKSYYMNFKHKNRSYVPL